MCSLLEQEAYACIISSNPLGVRSRVTRLFSEEGALYCKWGDGYKGEETAEEEGHVGWVKLILSPPESDWVTDVGEIT